MKKTTKKLFLYFALLPLLPLSCGFAGAQPCSDPACAEWFAPDAGAIDARAFGAAGDGRTDDTAALLRAIAASGDDRGRAVWRDRIVFLPAGIYRISATLLKRYADGAFASGFLLIGESPGRTILRLADYAPGFGDPAAPRAVVMTSSKRLDQSGGRDYAGHGEGNDAYENFVENLTIDVGHGNPGAIGIDYLANNIGAIRDVAVMAPPGSGATGIAMLRKWPGPALLQRVSVQGFAVGIDVAQSEYGVTLSQVRLAGQRVTGLRNADNMVTAEDLRIVVTGATALRNETPRGMVLLAGGSLATTDAAMAHANGGTILAGDGWLDGSVHHAQRPGWTLPHPFAPVVPAGPRRLWVGASGIGYDASPVDATGTLRAAFASGETVYLRHGIFWISEPVEIPATLHRIIGMNATIRVLPEARSRFPRTKGLFRVTQPGSPLLIERLALDNTDQGEQSGVEVSAARTVVLRDVFGAGVVTLDRRAAGGPAFLEDTCCGRIAVAGAAPAIARQLDTEGSGVRVLNQGAPLAILGLKTEGICTAIRTFPGGRTEVLGGVLYQVRVPDGDPAPAFVTEDASLVARFVEESLQPRSAYKQFLVDRRGGVSREVLAAAMPARGLGRLVPLLWAGEAPVGR